MTAVNHLADDDGQRTAAVQVTRLHRRLQEDLCDRLLVESRRGEPRESLGSVRDRHGRRSAKRRD